MKHCQQEMTVIQNAWPVVCNFGWLIEADRNARKGKRYRAEVLNFTARLEDNLFTIQQGMMNGSYVLGPYRKLWVYVPKKRLVMALDYPDRIVQAQAENSLLYPLHGRCNHLGAGQGNLAPLESGGGNFLAGGAGA